MSRDDLSDLFSAADKNLKKTQEVVQTASEKNQERMGRDRSWIALGIIVTYLIAIFGAIVYIIFGVPDCLDAACTNPSASFDKQAELLKDLIITAVVPIVTLMLGFYFGTEKDSNPE